MPPLLRGFVCAYHPAALGSSPKHAIYAFSFIVFVLYLSCEKNENKQKRGRVWSIFLKKKWLWVFETCSPQEFNLQYNNIIDDDNDDDNDDDDNNDDDDDDSDDNDDDDNNDDDDDDNNDDDDDDNNDDDDDDDI